MFAPTALSARVPIERMETGAFRVPTDFPESDGTLEWNATELVVVEISAGGETGLGYTYASAGAARLISGELAEELRGRDAMQIEALTAAMFARLRNQGRQGLAAMAVSAVDAGLWDLKARHHGRPLVELLSAAREALPVYGSGGFTSYSDGQLQDQFRRWAAQGIGSFKMKVGREPARDAARVQAARAAIGTAAGLFVDANSAYTPRQALACARRFADEAGVCWLEEPLPPEDLAGMRFLRRRLPAAVELAEGEYGYDPAYFRRLIEADAADVVMADITRCGGVTGLLKIAALCEAWARPLSTHGAPALHLHAGCALAPLRHAEYFHDHARIERLLFDGAVEPRDGALHPDLSRPGHGLEFKWADAEKYAV